MENKIDAILYKMLLITSKNQFKAIPAVAQDAYDYLNKHPFVKNGVRLIFVRHGESTSNQEQSIAGRILDVDLSEKGIQQAQSVGSALVHCPIQAAYSSPSLRAQRTAYLIIQNISNQIQLQLDERLYEKYYGPYEGATEQEYAPVKAIEEHYSSGPHTPFQEKFHFKVHQQMESMADVYERVSTFLQDVHQQYLEQTILISTHNGVMKALFMHASAQQGFEIDYRSYILINCAILVVEMNSYSLQVVASHGLQFIK